MEIKIGERKGGTEKFAELIYLLLGGMADDASDLDRGIDQ